MVVPGVFVSFPKYGDVNLSIRGQMHKAEKSAHAVSKQTHLRQNLKRRKRSMSGCSFTRMVMSNVHRVGSEYTQPKSSLQENI